MVLTILMLFSSSAVALAEEGGTKFIKTNGSMALTQDGRLYRFSAYDENGLDLIDTNVIDTTDSSYIKKDAYITSKGDIIHKEANAPDYCVILDGIVQNVNGDIVYPRGNEMTDVQTNGKKIIQNCNDVYFLAEDNVLYKVYNKYNYYSLSKIADNVIDVRLGGGIGLLYRDLNSDLYQYDKGSKLILKNCSDVYGLFDGNANDDCYYARTNDGKWYHWGYNSENVLEPIKKVDGINITPYYIEEPMQATEYIWQDEYRGNKNKIHKLIWSVDGNLYYNGTKVADDVVRGWNGRRFITSGGDVIVFTDRDEYKYFDVNLVDFDEYFSRGIDKNGDLYYLEDNGVGLLTHKIVRAGYKYMNRSDWANAEIALADEIGYIDSVKLFDMQSNIRREDFCNMIVDFCEKYLGKELSTTSNPFEDTENEKVIKAYANGIITGVSSDKFAPDDRITREQMCAIMTRATKFLKPDVQFGQGIAFSDMHTVSDWAVEGVNAMSGLGIVKGDGVSITPKSNTSVEQAIAMTYRLYNKIK